MNEMSYLAADIKQIVNSQMKVEIRRLPSQIKLTWEHQGKTNPVASIRMKQHQFDVTLHKKCHLNSAIIENLFFTYLVIRAHKGDSVAQTELKRQKSLQPAPISMESVGFFLSVLLSQVLQRRFHCQVQGSTLLSIQSTEQVTLANIVERKGRYFAGYEMELMSRYLGKDHAAFRSVIESTVQVLMQLHQNKTKKRY